MIKIVTAALAAPLMVLLQSTLLYQALPGDHTPDLILIFTMAFAFTWGSAGGTAMGLWGGVLVGAVRGGFSLPLACLYGAVGWLAGLFTEQSRRKWLFPVVGACLTVLLTVGDGELGSRMSGEVPTMERVLGSLGWNCTFCLLLFWVRPPRGSSSTS